MSRTICIFCETWESGGIESFLRNVLLHMDLTGLAVDIVIEQQKESVFTRRLVDAGIHFVELSGSTRNLRQNISAFRKLLDQRRYDVVHLNIFQGMSLYYAELARQAGVPVRIAHSHNTALRKSVARPIKTAIHRIFRRRYTDSATHLWACSGDAARFMFPTAQLEARGFQFIPNGIDVERFRFQPEVRQQVRQELGVTDAFVIGNVGRLCYQKNQGFLLDVLAELLKDRPDSRLLLAGEGEDRPMLQQRAEELKIADKVIFYGTSSQVETLLWAMDVFAFPSRFEGLGIAAVEAQAAGLPVLCSENVPEEANTTALFSTASIEEGTGQWTEMISAMALKKERQNRIKYAELVREKGFAVQDVAERIESVYRQGG